ncbi:hypothetical protein Pmani_002302 [Petrolisthes manimaculis]|uniref:Kinesin motor domain-containing protein n=1 Tax=Petrolisthes manimaculis TaxID=1843537 RepID=A0AAE1UNL4_9EUCA|nr:hypothetical protein Pmani_002302 [Petrolisthes manimaculis]
MEVPIRVVARVRPGSAQEQGRGTCVAAAPASSQIILGYDHFSDFDAVFGPEVGQKEVYQACVADLVTNFFQGYNVTVVGYGQRGAGKTYTVTGPAYLLAMNEEEFGLLPQAVRHVFNLMRECGGREYRIHVSYLVVQREAVFDLLSTSNSYLQLNVLEDNMGNVVIPGLNLVDCSNITEVFNCLEAGLVHRHTASLHTHDPSTSHHAIFSLTLEHQWTDQEGKLRYLYSRLNFVDLGGSEGLMQGNLGLPGHDSFFLNSDLAALSNVIHCLANQSYTGPVPYRESTLTHVLKDAFGGNSLTLMMCCLSPSPEDFDATFSTLKYGGLARYILNCPAVNLAIQDSSRASLATTHTATTPSAALRQQSSSSRQSQNSIRQSQNSIRQSQSSIRQSQNSIRQSQNSVRQSQGSVQQSTVTNDTSALTVDEARGSVENEDVFRLQFAASQWHLLVASAEDLLSEILHTQPPEKSRIEAWLCMKQEAEECIGLDPGSLRLDQNNRVLDVIEELSEPEANWLSLPTSTATSTRAEGSHRSSSPCSSSSSSMVSLGDEFYDQLAVLETDFRTLVEQRVEHIQDSHDTYARLQESAERRRTSQETLRDTENPTAAKTHLVTLSSGILKPSDTIGHRGELSGASDAVSVHNGLQASSDMSRLQRGPPQGTTDNTRYQRGLQGAPWITKDSVNASRRSISSGGTVLQASTSLSQPEEMREGKWETGRRHPSPTHSQNSSCESDNDSTHKSHISTKESQNQARLPRRRSSCSSLRSSSSSSSRSSSPKSSQRSSHKSSQGSHSRTSSQPTSKGVGGRGGGTALTTVAEELKRLTASHESRRSQVRRVSLELRTAHQRLKQLNATIRMKEAFIRELVRGGGEAEMTRRKCEAKMEKVEREVERARHHLHRHRETQEEDEGGGDVRKLQGNTGLLKKQISHYQKKLTTLQKVAHISQQADSKVSEVESSVRSLRRQQEALQLRLKEEGQRKEELEQKITLDKRKIRELEVKLKEGEKEEGEESERGWLAEEEERIIKLREATQQLQTEVERREEAVKQRERMHKEKMRLQTSRRSGKDKEEGQDDTEDDEGVKRESDLREEISHLRDARDSLMVRRQKLDTRIHRSGVRVSSGEERRLLELDEAIEAVDAAIEYKNEVICGRTKELRSHALLLNQDNLMERLMNLCPEETRSLLVKYFNKVIDLRTEFRKQDLAFSELESQYEEQSRYVSDLKAAYQQASLEMERRITSQQRDYQHKISTLLRQFNDDSSGSGPHEFRVHELEKQLLYYKKLSRDLKGRLRQYGEEVTTLPPRARDPLPGPSSQASPSHPGQSPAHHPTMPAYPHAPVLPRRTRLQAAEQVAKCPIPQTKVTRERNKIIIQQKSERQGGGGGGAGGSGGAGGKVKTAMESR